jgi:hypothetical protein
MMTMSDYKGEADYNRFLPFGKASGGDLELEFRKILKRRAVMAFRFC